MLPLPVRAGRPRADGLGREGNSLCERAGWIVRLFGLAILLSHATGGLTDAQSGGPKFRSQWGRS